MTNTATTCYFPDCGRVLGSLRDGDACLVNTSHWTGEFYTRIECCAGCMRAGKVAKAPRKPRASRRTTTSVPATDWNYLVVFSRRPKH